MLFLFINLVFLTPTYGSNHFLKQSNNIYQEHIIIPISDSQYELQAFNPTIISVIESVFHQYPEKKILVARYQLEPKNTRESWDKSLHKWNLGGYDIEQLIVPIELISYIITMSTVSNEPLKYFDFIQYKNKVLNSSSIKSLYKKIKYKYSITEKMLTALNIAQHIYINDLDKKQNINLCNTLWSKPGILHTLHYPSSINLILYKLLSIYNKKQQQLIKLNPISKKYLNCILYKISIEKIKPISNISKDILSSDKYINERKKSLFRLRDNKLKYYISQLLKKNILDRNRAHRIKVLYNAVYSYFNNYRSDLDSSIMCMALHNIFGGICISPNTILVNRIDIWSANSDKVDFLGVEKIYPNNTESSISYKYYPGYLRSYVEFAIENSFLCVNIQKPCLHSASKSSKVVKRFLYLLTVFIVSPKTTSLFTEQELDILLSISIKDYINVLEKENCKSLISDAWNINENQVSSLLNFLANIGIKNLLDNCEQLLQYSENFDGNISVDKTLIILPSSIIANTVFLDNDFITKEEINKFSLHSSSHLFVPRGEKSKGDSRSVLFKSLLLPVQVGSLWEQNIHPKSVIDIIVNMRSLQIVQPGLANSRYKIQKNTSNIRRKNINLIGLKDFSTFSENKKILQNDKSFDFLLPGILGGLRSFGNLRLVGITNHVTLEIEYPADLIYFGLRLLDHNDINRITIKCSEELIVPIELNIKSPIKYLNEIKLPICQTGIGIIKLKGKLSDINYILNRLYYVSRVTSNDIITIFFNILQRKQKNRIPLKAHIFNLENEVTIISHSSGRCDLSYRLLQSIRSYYPKLNSVFSCERESITPIDLTLQRFYDNILFQLRDFNWCRITRSFSSLINPQVNRFCGTNDLSLPSMSSFLSSFIPNQKCVELEILIEKYFNQNIFKYHSFKGSFNLGKNLFSIKNCILSQQCDPKLISLISEYIKGLLFKNIKKQTNNKDFNYGNKNILKKNKQNSFNLINSLNQKYRRLIKEIKIRNNIPLTANKYSYINKANNRYLQNFYLYSLLKIIFVKKYDPILLKLLDNKAKQNNSLLYKNYILINNIISSELTRIISKISHLVVSLVISKDICKYSFEEFLSYCQCSNNKYLRKFITLSIPIQGKNTTILSLPWDTGLSAAREILINSVKTKYVILLDDDMVFSGLSNIEALVGQMLEFKLLGKSKTIISTSVPEDERIFGVFRGTLRIASGVLLLENEVRNTYSNGIVDVDIAPNVYIGDVKELKKMQWKYELKLGEHEHFFYKNLENNLKTAVSFDCTFNHIKKKNPKKSLEKYANFLFIRNLINSIKLYGYNILIIRKIQKPNINTIFVNNEDSGISHLFFSNQVNDSIYKYKIILKNRYDSDQYTIENKTNKFFQIDLINVSDLNRNLITSKYNQRNINEENYFDNSLKRIFYCYINSTSSYVQYKDFLKNYISKSLISQKKNLRKDYIDNNENIKKQFYSLGLINCSVLIKIDTLNGSLWIWKIIKYPDIRVLTYCRYHRFNPYKNIIQKITSSLLTKSSMNEDKSLSFKNYSKRNEFYLNYKYVLDSIVYSKESNLKETSYEYYSDSERNRTFRHKENFFLFIHQDHKRNISLVNSDFKSSEIYGSLLKCSTKIYKSNINYIERRNRVIDFLRIAVLDLNLDSIIYLFKRYDLLSNGSINYLLQNKLPVWELVRNNKAYEYSNSFPASVVTHFVESSYRCTRDDLRFDYSYLKLTARSYLDDFQYFFLVPVSERFNNSCYCDFILKEKLYQCKVNFKTSFNQKINQTDPALILEQGINNDIIFLPDKKEKLLYWIKFAKTSILSSVYSYTFDTVRIQQIVFMDIISSFLNKSGILGISKTTKVVNSSSHIVCQKLKQYTLVQEPANCEKICNNIKTEKYSSRKLQSYITNSLDNETYNSSVLIKYKSLPINLYHSNKKKYYHKLGRGYFNDNFQSGYKHNVESCKLVKSTERLYWENRIFHNSNFITVIRSDGRDIEIKKCDEILFSDFFAISRDVLMTIGDDYILSNINPDYNLFLRWMEIIKVQKWCIYNLTIERIPLI